MRAMCMSYLPSNRSIESEYVPERSPVGLGIPPTANQQKNSPPSAKKQTALRIRSRAITSRGSPWLLEPISVLQMGFLPPYRAKRSW